MLDLNVAAGIHVQEGLVVLFKRQGRTQCLLLVPLGEGIGDAEGVGFMHLGAPLPWSRMDDHHDRLQLQDTRECDACTYFFARTSKHPCSIQLMKRSLPGLAFGLILFKVIPAMMSSSKTLSGNKSLRYAMQAKMVLISCCVWRSDWASCASHPATTQTKRHSFPSCIPL